MQIMLERRALQIAVALAGLVPMTAGALGLLAPGLLGLYGDRVATAHFAYLSGMLLAVGMAYWWLIPDIERRGGSFTLLTAIVFVGGLARLSMAVRLASLQPGIGLPLLMELSVAPLLWAWQQRVAHKWYSRTRVLTPEA
jgi:hypothetical protein